MNYIKLRLHVFTLILFAFSGILSTANGQGTKIPKLLLDGKEATHNDKIIVKTYGDGDFTLNFTSSSGGKITYAVKTGDNATLSGTNNALVTIKKAGRLKINANIEAKGEYLAHSFDIVVIVKRGEPELQANGKLLKGAGNYSFIANKRYGDAIFDLDITSNSSGKIKVTTSGALISLSGKNNQVVTIKQAGAAEIMITVEADDKYEKVSYHRGIFIAKRSGTISMNGKVVGNHVISKTYGDPQFDLGAKGNSTGKMTYSFTPKLGGEGIISLSGVNNSIVTIHQAQALLTDPDTYRVYPAPPVKVIIKIAGDINHYETEITIGVAVKRAPLTMIIHDITRQYHQSVNPKITFTGFVNKDNETALGITKDKMLEYNSSVGKHIMDASSSLKSNRKYELFIRKGTLTVTKTHQTITFAPLADIFRDKVSSIRLAATSSSPYGHNRKIIYSCSDPEIAEIPSYNNGQLLIKKAGTVQITASQAGDGVYSDAPKVTRTLVIKPGVAGVNLQWKGNDVVSGANIDMGTTTPNASRKLEMSKTVVIKNKGTATLKYSAKVSGTHASNFKVWTTGDRAPEEEGRVVITFEAVDTETKTAQVTLTTNDPNNKIVVLNVKAAGQAPMMQVTQEGTTIPASTGSYDFGTVQRSSVATFTITNTGNNPLNLNGRRVAVWGNSGGEFELVTRPDFTTISAGESKTVQVRFTPGALETRTAKMTISSDAFHFGEYTFALTGKAKSQVTGLPTTLQNATLKTGPNPTTNYLTLQLNGQASSDIQYQLINTQGKAVLSGQGKLQNGRMTIDLSQVKQGNYLLKLQLGKEQIIRRIIKL